MSKKTLLDEFAIAALAGGLEQGVCSDVGNYSPEHPSWWHQSDNIAQRAYAIAQAMMDQKEQIEEYDNA